MSSRAGLVLSGGEVLLSVEGARHALRAITVALEVQRRQYPDVPVSTAVRDLLDLLRSGSERAAAAETAGSGSPAVASEGSRATSVPTDPIGLQEAATMLGCKARNTRDLCQRGALVTATKMSGRWVVERAEVLELVAERDAA